MQAPVMIEAFDPVDDVEPGQRTGVVAKLMGALELKAGIRLGKNFFGASPASGPRTASVAADVVNFFGHVFDRHHPRPPWFRLGVRFRRHRTFQNRGSAASLYGHEAPDGKKREQCLGEFDRSITPDLHHTHQVLLSSFC
jgi:hypothetical protein